MKIQNSFPGKNFPKKLLHFIESCSHFKFSIQKTFNIVDVVKMQLVIIMKFSMHLVFLA